MPSFKNKDLGEGLYGGGPTTLAKFYFSTTDYNGTAAKPVTVLCVDMVPDDDDTEPFTQNFGVGQGWQPSKDGKDLEPAKGAKKTSLSAQSGAGMLLRSLYKPVDDADNGFPDSMVEDDIGVFNGVKVNLVRREREAFKPRAGQGGLTKGAGAPEQAQPGSILVVSEILELPPAVRKAAGKPEAKGKKVATEDEDTDTGVDATPAQRKRATKIISKTLTAAGEAMTTLQLGKAVFKELKGDEDQATISQLAADEAFLSNQDAPWEFNGDEIKI